MKSFEESDRKEILQNSNISTTNITSEEMVALKADLGLPWEKLKAMAR